MLVPTPFGRDLFVAGGDDGVTESRFVARARPGERGANREAPHPLLRDVQRQLDAYFAGRLRRFDVPLALDGTPRSLRRSDGRTHIAASLVPSRRRRSHF
jgi:methylated-DNA-[protein]-cysteine S-methyltransferase